MNLTHARLKELLSYDRDAGTFSWNNSGKGKKLTHAGCSTSRYTIICIEGIKHYAHRLAWLYVTGSDPSGEIDHINGDKLDNRFSNLRDVSREINEQNKNIARSDNKSGLRGVYWFSQRGKWISRISVNGRKHYLGLFETANSAHEAYVKAKRILHKGNTL